MCIVALSVRIAHASHVKRMHIARASNRKQFPNTPKKLHISQKSFKEPDAIVKNTQGSCGI
eukprot:8235557-Pyramimonas_sp.AAC.1